MTWLRSSPDAALLTLLAGILLIYLEANRPGRVVPGSLGALLTLLSLDALCSHPLHLPAVAFIGGGFVLTVAAIFRPTFNLLALAGALSQAYGLFTLFSPPARIHPATAALFAAGFCFSTAWLGRVALLARRNKRQSGARRSTPVSPKVD